MKSINRNGVIVWINATWYENPSEIGQIHREGSPAILLDNGTSAVCDWESTEAILPADGQQSFIQDWAVMDALKRYGSRCGDPL